MLVAFADADVAPHAVAVRRGHVRAVIEHEVVAGLRQLGERGRRHVARETRMRVVRLGMTLDAGRVGREVQRAAVVVADPDVAPRTRHAGERVLAVRERLRAVVREPEDAGARGERRERRGDDRERDAPHRAPHVRPSWTSVSTRRRSVGDAEASIATAACHGPPVQLSAASPHGHTRPRP